MRIIKPTNRIIAIERSEVNNDLRALKKRARNPIIDTAIIIRFDSDLRVLP